MVQYYYICIETAKKMAGRPKIFNEKNALDKAVGLFWEKGYSATSTEDLMQVMGLRRGSFYHTFKSKKDLYIAALNSHENNSFDEFEAMLKKTQAPIETLKTAFLALADCPDKTHMLGCFAGNTIAELSGIDEELVEKAIKHLKRFESIITRQIRSSQKSGELKTKKDPALLGKYLLNLWNGLNLTRRMYPDKRILKGLISFHLELIR
jgi:TetR/AcrR family transcriptional repressor of nem operon